MRFYDSGKKDDVWSSYIIFFMYRPAHGVRGEQGKKSSLLDLEERKNFITIERKVSVCL